MTNLGWVGSAPVIRYFETTSRHHINIDIDIEISIHVHVVCCVPVELNHCGFFIMTVVTHYRIERVVIAGVKSEPSSVTLVILHQQEGSAGGLAEPRSLGFVYDAARQLLTVRKPDAGVAQDFDMTIAYPVSTS